MSPSSLLLVVPQLANHLQLIVLYSPQRFRRRLSVSELVRAFSIAFFAFRCEQENLSMAHHLRQEFFDPKH
jgi:hypothetical protein